MQAWQNIFPVGQHTLLLPGAVGQIEAMSLLPEAMDPNYFAICCHPHPLHQGTMHNKVVTSMAQACCNLGIASLRFNFRGVGESDGIYGDIAGELDDLIAVVTWLQQHQIAAQFILMGFSFGSFIAAKYASQFPTAYLLSVAPPVHRFKFSDLSVIQCPWLIIQGDKDELVPSVEVYDWIAQLQPTPMLEKMSQAGHFFHGNLMTLRKLIETNLQKHLSLTPVVK
jgi:uncharacterized protein